MARVALWVQLEAKPGREQEVADFLRSAQSLAEQETQTASWYAVRMAPNRFGIFDTFADEAGRDAHMTGEIAKQLFAKALDLFAREPEIHKIELLAAKGGAAASATA
jgi:quinol monooxygenase YgiN